MANVIDLNVGLRRRLEDMGGGRTILTALFAGGYLANDSRLANQASINNLGADWLAKARAARDEIRTLEAGGGLDRLLVSLPPGVTSDKNRDADTGTNHLVTAALIAGELHDFNAGDFIARAITHPMDADWDVLFDGLGIVARNYLASGNPGLVLRGRELDALVDELTYEEQVYLNARLFNPETRRDLRYPASIAWANLDAAIVHFGVDYLRIQAASTNGLRVALEGGQVRNTPNRDAKLFNHFLRSLNPPEGVTPTAEDLRDLLALSQLIQDVYPHITHRWRPELTVERLQTAFQPEHLWREGRLDHEVLDAGLLRLRDLVYGNNLIPQRNNEDAELMETRVEALMTAGYWRWRDVHSNRLIGTVRIELQFPQYYSREWVAGRSNSPNPEGMRDNGEKLSGARAREGDGVLQGSPRAPSGSLTILGLRQDTTWLRYNAADDTAGGVLIAEVVPSLPFAFGTRRVSPVVIDVDSVDVLGDRVSVDAPARDYRAFAERLWPTGQGGDEEQALQAAFHRMLATIFLNLPEGEADALVRRLTYISREVPLSFEADVDPHVLGLYVGAVQDVAQGYQEIDLGEDLGDLMDYLGDANSQSADHVEAGSVAMASMRTAALARMVSKARI